MPHQFSELWQAMHGGTSPGPTVLLHLQVCFKMLLKHFWPASQVNHIWHFQYNGHITFLGAFMASNASPRSCTTNSNHLRPENLFKFVLLTLSPLIPSDGTVFAPQDFKVPFASSASKGEARKAVMWFDTPEPLSSQQSPNVSDHDPIHKLTPLYHIESLYLEHVSSTLFSKAIKAIAVIVTYSCQSLTEVQFYQTRTVHTTPRKTDHTKIKTCKCSR